MVNKRRMFKDLFHESNTLILLGGKGVGKTNFSAVIMQELVSLGYDIWTNIHFFEYTEVGTVCKKGKLPKGIDYIPLPSQIHVFYKLSELLYGLLKPGPKVVIIDEGGIVSPSGISKDTKTLKQLAYIIRHFDCAFMIVTQVTGSVPPDLRTNLVDYRLKINKSGRMRFLDIGQRETQVDEFGEEYIGFPIVKSFAGIPMSILPYDGDFPSSLNFDIDLKKTLDKFGKLKSSLEVEKKGKEILDDLVQSGNQLSKKELIHKYKKEHPHEKRTKIAKMFKTSPRYVSQC